MVALSVYPQFSPQLLPQVARPIVMRKTAWIWLAGCIAWSFDAAVSITLHSATHAALAIVLAMLFGIAWLFYRSQPR